jgi:hypothetical protein
MFTDYFVPKIFSFLLITKKNAFAEKYPVRLPQKPLVPLNHKSVPFQLGPASFPGWLRVLK